MRNTVFSEANSCFAPVEAGVLHAHGLVQQVRPAQIPGEHEVAGEDVAGLVGEGAVGDQVAQVLGGVARGVAGGDRDVAELDRVMVLQALGLEAVLPVLAAGARRRTRSRRWRRPARARRRGNRRAGGSR